MSQRSLLPIMVLPIVVLGAEVRIIMDMVRWVTTVVVCGLLWGCGSSSSSDGAGGAGAAHSGGPGAGPGGSLGIGGWPSGQGGGEPACSDMLAVLRDFDVSHSDFEDENPGLTTGLVEPTLTGDNPTYAHGNTKQGGIENAASFAQWYDDVPGVNQRFEISLPLSPTGDPGVYEYSNDFFFPLDGMGFGNSGQDHNGMDRNFHFTTEIHTQFEYQPGQQFTFRGDDDLWLFIDKKLAIDLGGTHGALERTVDLDDLGLTPGQTYAMDIFHAERHTHASNFRMTTSIECFQPPPK